MHALMKMRQYRCQDSSVSRSHNLCSLSYITVGSIMPDRSCESFLAYLLVPILYFDIDSILNLARQFSVVAYPAVAVIGMVQGLVIGGAIVERFPRMLSHARLASALLFTLFAANAIVSVINFAESEKVDIAGIFASPSTDNLVSALLGLVGMNAGAGAIIALSLTLLIFILLKFTTLKRSRRIFVFIISVIMIAITVTLRLSEYKPTGFEIILYTLYQAGITAGILWGTRRRLSSTSLRFRYFREKWVGE